MDGRPQVYEVAIIDDAWGDGLRYESVMFVADSPEHAKALMWGDEYEDELEADGGEWTISRREELEPFVGADAKPGRIRFTVDQYREAGWRFDGDRECECCGDVRHGDGPEPVCADCNLCPACAADAGDPADPCDTCGKPAAAGNTP